MVKKRKPLKNPLPQKDIRWLRGLQKKIWKEVPSGIGGTIIKFFRPLTEKEIEKVFGLIKDFSLPCTLMPVVFTSWFQIYNQRRPKSKSQEALLILTPRHFDTGNDIQAAGKKLNLVGRKVFKKAKAFMLPIIQSNRNKKALRENRLFTLEKLF